MYLITKFRLCMKNNVYYIITFFASVFSLFHLSHLILYFKSFINKYKKFNTNACQIFDNLTFIIKNCNLHLCKYNINILINIGEKQNMGEIIIRYCTIEHF